MLIPIAADFQLLPIVVQGRVPVLTAWLMKIVPRQQHLDVIWDLVQAVYQILIAVISLEHLSATQLLPNVPCVLAILIAPPSQPQNVAMMSVLGVLVS